MGCYCERSEAISGDCFVVGIPRNDNFSMAFTIDKLKSDKNEIWIFTKLILIRRDKQMLSRIRHKLLISLAVALFSQLP
jgi:DNA repair photolyase